MVLIAPLVILPILLAHPDASVGATVNNSLTAAGSLTASGTLLIMSAGAGAFAPPAGPPAPVPGATVVVALASHQAKSGSSPVIFLKISSNS